MSLDRARLAELADVLIPAEGGMPSASEAGAAGEWLDAVLAARPDFETPLAGLAARPRGCRPPRRSRRCRSATPPAGRR